MEQINKSQPNNNTTPYYTNTHTPFMLRHSNTTLVHIGLQLIKQ